MDEFSGQRAAGGLAISRRGRGLSFRDSNCENKSIQYCNRLACSTRPSPMKGTDTINRGKAKYSRPSHSLTSKMTIGSSSSCKNMVGSSSKTLAGMSSLRKHHHRLQQNPTLLKETTISECSSSRGEVEAIEPILSSTGIQDGQTESENVEGAVCHGLSVNSTEEVSNTRPQKKSQQSALNNHYTSVGSSIRRSLSSRNANQAAKSQGQVANTHRYGLRNIGCASISDIFPSSSLSDYSRKRINMIKKRCPTDGESPLARGKKVGGSSSVASSQRTSLSSTNLSSTDHLTSQPTSRRTRYWSAGSSSVTSVRTHRTISGDTSIMIPSSESENLVSMPERIMIPQLPQAEFSINESATGPLSRSFPTERSVYQNSFRRPGSSSETARSRPIIHPEDNSTQPLHSFSLDRDGFQHFNMEGVAEVLLALERIEQDEELTYEQLLVLESNLLLGGLSFHDQHRDMRLDIDNMSYEELLALEEKMGTVSTALSEEQLSKCLKRSTYALQPPAAGLFCNGNDDIKCSICQEEYAPGDEVGKLGCEHRYHLECIHQWLRQKNWCPICKASALPSSWYSPEPVAVGSNLFV